MSDPPSLAPTDSGCLQQHCTGLTELQYYSPTLYSLPVSLSLSRARPASSRPVLPVPEPEPGLAAPATDLTDSAAQAGGGGGMGGGALLLYCPPSPSSPCVATPHLSGLSTANLPQCGPAAPVWVQGGVTTSH